MKSLLFFTYVITSIVLAIVFARPSSAQEITKGQKKAMRWVTSPSIMQWVKEGRPAILILNFADAYSDRKPTIPNRDFPHLSGKSCLGSGYQKPEYQFWIWS